VRGPAAAEQDRDPGIAPELGLDSAEFGDDVPVLVFAPGAVMMEIASTLPSAKFEEKR
jgi:hypothetical protein